MPKKRGFFAEMQRQAAQAQRRQQQAASTASRAQAAAQRQAEQAQKQAQRASTQASRATAAEQKAAEREAARLHEEAQRAEVEARNAVLAAQYDEIDSILQATLGVDDFVDVEALRTTVAHPPFPRADLETPLVPPVPLRASAEPLFVGSSRFSGV